MFEFEVLDGVGVGCGINPVGQLTKRPNVNSVPDDAKSKVYGLTPSQL